MEEHCSTCYNLKVLSLKGSYSLLFMRLVIITIMAYFVDLEEDHLTLLTITQQKFPTQGMRHVDLKLLKMKPTPQQITVKLGLHMKPLTQGGSNQWLGKM